MRLPQIDKGDYLTFASIGKGLGMPFLIMPCELSPGVWRRHPVLRDSESRSDISRDGYIGVLFWALTTAHKDTRKEILSDIISAGWKRHWTMGDRGDFDYVNIWPLIPHLYAARYGKWVPTPPVPIWGKAKTGYRAHLAAMIIMIDMLIGKSYTKHISSVAKLIHYNPSNPLFAALGKTTVVGPETYEWGGCPPEIHQKLTEFAKELMK